MMLSARIFLTPVLLLSIFVPCSAYSQSNPIEVASENFSSCLESAVIAERQKSNPTVHGVKATCESEIDTLYSLLGDAVTNLPSLDERLQEELDQ